MQLARILIGVFVATVMSLAVVACGGDDRRGGTDGGGGSDSGGVDSGGSDAARPDGSGMACGATTCTASQVCCSDCDGNQGCFAGESCPGISCFDGGPDVDGGTSTADAGGVTGCAFGDPPCGVGLVCCTGVPYPEDGVCREACDMNSDRAIKHDVRRVDPDAMLDRLASLPIAEWSYRAEPGGVRHVGPMAQDFRAAFGLGSSDRTIHPVDAAGVTMAAVQALHRELESVRAAQEDLARENEALRREVEALRESGGACTP